MATQYFRSIFVSDVHLGTPDCKADYLLDFLRTVRCEHLYLVGDIIDLQALRTRPYWPATHGAVLDRIQQLARTGTRVTYIPGNHDAPLRALAGRRIGDVEVALHAMHLGMDGRCFRVSHGDEYDPLLDGKRWLYRLGDRAQQLICLLNRILHRARRLLALPYLPLTIAIKSRLGTALAYIQHHEHLAAAGARALGCDGYIGGHIHFGGIRDIDGVLYCNEGDWVEHCTALTEDHLGQWRLLHWSERQSCLAQAPHPSPPRTVSPVAPMPVHARVQPARTI